MVSSLRYHMTVVWYDTLQKPQSDWSVRVLTDVPVYEACNLPLKHPLRSFPLYKQEIHFMSRWYALPTEHEINFQNIMPPLVIKNIYMSVCLQQSWHPNLFFMIFLFLSCFMFMTFFLHMLSLKMSLILNYDGIW